MTLTPSQIEVLARFDGWEKRISATGSFYWIQKSTCGHNWDIQMQDYLLNPFNLIKIYSMIRGEIQSLWIDEDLTKKEYSELQKDFNQLGDLIVSGEYTAAAIKTSEIIQKLEA
jgi:hypothetical protein